MHFAFVVSFPQSQTGSVPHKAGAKTSEVAEESEGWIRLRTVTAEWNSDEEGNAPVGDLRDKLTVCVLVTHIFTSTTCMFERWHV